MAPPRILILGHSFIRRLAGFLQKRGHEHLMAKLSPLGHISFHGVGGRTIVKNFDLSMIRRLSPNIRDFTQWRREALTTAFASKLRHVHAQ